MFGVFLIPLLLIQFNFVSSLTQINLIELNDSDTSSFQLIVSLFSAFVRVCVWCLGLSVFLLLMPYESYHAHYIQKIKYTLHTTIDAAIDAIYVMKSVVALFVVVRLIVCVFFFIIGFFSLLSFSLLYGFVFFALLMLCFNRNYMGKLKRQLNQTIFTGNFS